VQITRLTEYASCKGLTFNVDKSALMVCNDKRLFGSADQVVFYQGMRIPVVDGFKYLGLWMDKHMSMKEAAHRTRGGLMPAWRELVPVAVNAGVRYMPRAMVLLVKTYVFQRAMYASQVLGADLLHPSPCGESDLQSEMLSIFRRLLALRGSVARASLMDELGVHPLQVHWLKACVTFFRAACASQHSSPLFYRAMFANVVLSRHSDTAWCAKLVKFLAVVGVEDGHGSCIGHMDMGNPPGVGTSVRRMIAWAMDIRQAELHNATVQATYVRHFRMAPMGEVARMHGYLTTGLRVLHLPKKVVLSMARFRLSSHNLRIETGRHEGLPRSERSCCRCKRLLGENFVAPIDDEEHLLFSCEGTKDIRLRFSGLPMSTLRDLMEFEDVCRVAWFVHECMIRADNSHTG